LANLVRNEKNLARDRRLLGELTQTLDDELARSDPDEPTLQFLAAALGSFQVIEGQPSSGRAVDPLSSLAEALQPRRPMAVRIAAAESLARLAAVSGGESRSPRAIDALIRAASDPEPDLRQLAVYALGFHRGDAVDNALRAALDDSDRLVRYNAANALARRGDPAAMPVLREMLSTAELEASVRSENPDETQHRVESIQLEALAALEAAARRGHTSLAGDLAPEVGALKESTLAGVRMQAESLGKILQNAPPAP
jgi:HEAT repeat protein